MMMIRADAVAPKNFRSTTLYIFYNNLIINYNNFRKYLDQMNDGLISIQHFINETPGCISSQLSSRRMTFGALILILTATVALGEVT